jgi:endonuclease-3
MNSLKEEKQKRAFEIFEILREEYPDARPLLNYSSPFELLIATILAAQCTDERVNRVTPTLFQHYPDPRSMATADTEELEKIIRPTGFFKNKAKSLKGSSAFIIENFNGTLPASVEELARLPGVGRKTANVVAGNCFGIPAIMVDTHVKRVTQRLELSTAKDPDRIEMELKEIVSEKNRTQFSKVINFHGRYVCQAKKPLCPGCRIAHLCPYSEKTL